jgi:hypothetical protein
LTRSGGFRRLLSRLVSDALIYGGPKGDYGPFGSLVFNTFGVGRALLHALAKTTLRRLGPLPGNFYISDPPDFLFLKVQLL